MSTLIFAAVWYPDLPELCDLRHIFAERYGNFFEHFVGQEVRKNMSLALHALVCLISLQVFAKKTVKFSVLDAMGLSSKPLHRGVKHDISCLSQDSYGAYISASCMDNRICLYSVLHMNKGLIKVYTGIKIRVFFRQGH